MYRFQVILSESPIISPVKRKNERVIKDIGRSGKELSSFGIRPSWMASSDLTKWDKTLLL